jgi:hypothetical protein
MLNPRYLFVPLGAATGLLVLASQGRGAAKHNSPWHVPQIAHLGGFTAGVDTIDAMEQRLGKTKAYIGQHPNSSHSWYFRKTHLELYADGFAYKEAGLLINTLDLTSDPQLSEKQAFASPSDRHRRGFLGTILPGMSRTTVVRLTRHRLPPPEIDHGDMAWTMEGRALIRRAERGYPEKDVTSWTTTLHFEHNVLTDIRVETDQ